jgi:hypothetical protein
MCDLPTKGQQTALPRASTWYPTLHCRLMQRKKTRLLLHFPTLGHDRRGWHLSLKHPFPLRRLLRFAELLVQGLVLADHGLKPRLYLRGQQRLCSVMGRGLHA